MEDTEVSLISFYSVIYLLDFDVFKNSNNDPPPTAPVEDTYYGIGSATGYAVIVKNANGSSLGRGALGVSSMEGGA
jgi:hypothetical protein